MPLILTPFRSSDFRLWSAANLISNTGTWMRVLAANWLLLTVTGSAAQMGLGLLAHTLPVLLLGAWAGTLADRLPARRLLGATQSAHALLAIVLAVVAWRAADPVPWVFAVMLVGGVVTAVDGPALGRFGSTLVPRDRLGPALAAGSLISSAGRIGGMSLGGALAAASGPAPLFLINAVGYLAVIGALQLVRGQPAEQVDTAGPEVPSSIGGGLRYVLSNPTVVITLALAFLLGSLGRNYQVTMAAMTEGPLAAGPDSYGFLSTVFAVGAAIGGVLAARAGRMYGRHLVVLGVGMGGLQAAGGLAPDVATFAAAVLPIAAAAVVVDTVIATRLQLDLPLAVRGRVLALLGATGASAGAIGAPLLGWLCDLLGARTALELAGGLTALGCVAAAAGYALVGKRSGPVVSRALRTPVRLAAAVLPAPQPLPAPQLTPPRLTPPQPAMLRLPATAASHEATTPVPATVPQPA